MNRGRKCGGFKFEENRVGFYGVSVLALGDISDNAARRNCDTLVIHPRNWRLKSYELLVRIKNRSN